MTDINVLSNVLRDYKAHGITPTSNIANHAGAITPAVNGVTANIYGPPYLLDISQAAQDLLNNQQGNSVAAQNGINLTDNQKQTLQSILAKYKDAPVNDQTLQSLDADLHQAGVAPDQLASIKKEESFNPVEAFLQILGGNTGNGDSNNPVFGSTGNNTSNDGALGSQLNALLQQYLTTQQTA